MNLTSAQASVETWMKQFGQDAPDSPVVPSLEVRKLRAKLMLEECLETVICGLGIQELWSPEGDRGCELKCFLEWVKNGRFDGFSTPDMRQIRDGIADMQVVTLGTAVACGIQAEPDFNEVMRSNFSKMWTDEEVERDKVERGDNSGITYRKVITNSPRCWLVKDASGKVIKSPSYSEAKLQ